MSGLAAEIWTIVINGLLVLYTMIALSVGCLWPLWLAIFWRCLL